MLVSAGIDFDQLDAVREGVLDQLESLRRGEITPEELDAAKKDAVNGLRTVTDSPAALESYLLRETVQGLEIGPDEMAALIEDVTAPQAAAVARSVELDAVYFLRGEEQA